MMPDPRIAISHALDALQSALADRHQVSLEWIEPPPETDGWTLAPDALQFLWRLMRWLKPRHYLEFGSGLSTRVALRCCADEALSCCISSIDHDPRFARASFDTVPGCKVELQVVPLVVADCGGKLLPQYLIDEQHLASTDPVDLVLIDGPPEVLGGREGTLYQAMNHVRPGTIVLVDDAHRGAEVRAMRCWQDVFADRIEVLDLPGFTKGLGAVIVKEVTPSAQLWNLRQERAREMLDGVLAATDRYALADYDRADALWLEDRRSVPLVVRNGVSWGAPESSEEAIGELQRCTRDGIAAFVTLWPSFWWRDFYAPLFTSLRKRYRCVVDNDLLLVFRLDQPVEIP
jgi:predicted O-methyltransferase YrrM